MLTLEGLCTHAMRFLHAPVRVFDNQNKLVIMKGDSDCADPLESDADFELQLLSKGNAEFPVFVADTDYTRYAVIRTKRGGTVICGPCCFGENVRKAVEDTIDRHHMDASKFFGISSVTVDIFYETVLMLFHSLNDTPLTKEDMLLKNFDFDEFTKKLDITTMNVFTDYREGYKVHNPYTQEQREQESIRRGDVQALKASIAEVYEGELGKMAKTSLRSAKNLAISVLALASRSAIAGGILPEVAFSLSDAYAIRIEEQRTEAEVEALLRKAEYHYTELVHELISKNNVNPIIMSCKDYVIKNINKKISLADVADALDMNGSYISDLFSREEGETLTDYILREKIAHAQRRLIYTDDTFSKIAYDFAFSSQSHFGKVFKKVAGITPKQYREKNKSNEV